MNDQTKPFRILRPKGLQQGDTIGLFAPAGPLLDKEIVLEGERLLGEMGFRVQYSPDICRQEYYLAGSDQQRLQEFNRLWQDPTVNALLAVRGGYGSARVLVNLSVDAIQKRPKLIIGFSDLTALLNGLQAKTGLVSIHGPMLSTLVRDGLDAAKCLLTGVTGSGLKVIRPSGIKVLRDGCQTGRLMGGNLTTLIHLIGTPFEPDWRNTIVCLEDVSEPAYKIDRMLTQLHIAKRLDQVAGVILGDFLDADNTSIDDIELVLERVLALTDASIPVWANFPIGHGPNNIVFPLGVEAIMDSNSETLTFKESYLRAPHYV